MCPLRHCLLCFSDPRGEVQPPSGTVRVPRPPPGRQAGNGAHLPQTVHQPGFKGAAAVPPHPAGMHVHGDKERARGGGSPEPPPIGKFQLALLSSLKKRLGQNSAASLGRLIPLRERTAQSYCPPSPSLPQGPLCPCSHPLAWPLCTSAGNPNSKARASTPGRT
jgi:hypothetical protein